MKKAFGCMFKCKLFFLGIYITQVRLFSYDFLIGDRL
jgi:hypothetical protein